MRPHDRNRIQVEVVSRVVNRHLERAASAAEGYLETIVNDTLYHERHRLEREHDRHLVRAETGVYDGIRKRMQHASESALRGLMEQLCWRFVDEIVGNFDERVYGLSTRLVPAGLWGLLNAMSPRRLMAMEGLREGPATQIEVQGEIGHVTDLLRKGTLIVLPTHSSNLDSIIIGYAAYLIGLPPLTYGAGLNLFTNPLISFFMRNLGAYRVDRKKASVLYKEVLKEYATVAMEMGYHNLFFPGGTRSRSGAVEQKLKKGLLGSAVRAYVNNLGAGRDKPNLYLAPCTMTYKLVLEGSTLISDFLSEVGKARYIIEDDEFSKPRMVFSFLSKLLSLEGRIVVTFSSPLDVIGNPVDGEGRSLDPQGRIVDLSSYFRKDGEVVFDDQRDAEYTREAADAVAQAFRRDNVILTTHLVAFALFRMLERANPGRDLYRLLRTGGKLTSFPMSEVHGEVDRVLTALKGRTDGPRLGSLLLRGDVQEIVADGLKAFRLYHMHPAAVRRGDRVFHEDRTLLLYYGNRLRGYGLE